MTEAEWLACTQTQPLLDRAWDRLSARKLRLIVCARARQSWEHLTDRRSQLAIEIAEAYADGRVPERERRWAIDAAQAAVLAHSNRYAQWVADDVDPRLTRETAMQRIDAADLARGTATLYPHRWLDAPNLAPVVRDLLGNPFQPEPAIDPTWLEWNRGIVRAMAEEIYESHRFEQLPILADALEEAGCADRTILQHCRGPDLHARGCWLLGAILGRELALADGVILRGPTAPPYRTIARTVGVDERYRRPAGPRGIFAHVGLRIAPQREGEGIAFGVYAQVRDHFPREYLAGIADGLRDHLANLDSAGENLSAMNIWVTIAGEHPVDSSRAAFQQAATNAFARALEQAGLVTIG
jgi:hypothetical protein